MSCRRRRSDGCAPDALTEPAAGGQRRGYVALRTCAGTAQVPCPSGARSDGTGARPCRGMRNLTSRRARRVHLSVTRAGKPASASRERRNGKPRVSGTNRHAPPPPFNRPREKNAARSSAGRQIPGFVIAQQPDMVKFRAPGTVTTAEPESLPSFPFVATVMKLCQRGHPAPRSERKTPRKCRVGKMVSNQKVQGGGSRGAEGFRTRRRGIAQSAHRLSPRAT